MLSRFASYPHIHCTPLDFIVFLCFSVIIFNILRFYSLFVSSWIFFFLEIIMIIIICRETHTHTRTMEMRVVIQQQNVGVVNFVQYHILPPDGRYKIFYSTCVVFYTLCIHKISICNKFWCTDCFPGFTQYKMRTISDYFAEIMLF